MDDREENKRTVRRFFIDGYVKKDWESVMELIAEEYADHGPCHATTNAECVSVLKITAEGFSDMSVTIEDMTAENDIVAARATFTCTHSGNGYGIPATGRRISFEALENFRVKNGRIVESWGYWPNGNILAQLEN